MEEEIREFNGVKIYYKVSEYSVRFQFSMSCIPDRSREIDGYVKWDGCSNWIFEEGHMIHFCDMKDVDALREVVGECYKLAKNLLDNWEGD